MKPRHLLLFACIAGVGMIPSAGAQNPTHKPGGFHSPDLPSGVSWTLTLTEPGTYYYHCHPHPFMHGVIDVTEDAPGHEVFVDVVDYDFAPDHVSIRPGGRVNWTNTGSTLHTVDESIPPAGDEGPKGGQGVPAVPATILLLASVATMAVMLRRRQPF